jgi:hypothetical protein
MKAEIVELLIPLLAGAYIVSAADKMAIKIWGEERGAGRSKWLRWLGGFLVVVTLLRGVAVVMGWT